MAVSETNKIRYRAVLVSRVFKELFGGVPARFAKRLGRRWFAGLLWRWLFLDDKGELHNAGEMALAELRDTYLLQSAFSSDPLVMARRVGQREVLETIFNYLNLDEATVQTLMRLDDGLE